MVGILENTHVAYIKKDKHGQNYNKNLSKFIVFILFSVEGRIERWMELMIKASEFSKPPRPRFLLFFFLHAKNLIDLIHHIICQLWRNLTCLHVFL